ncbi:MAG: DUF2164 domain-containing protein [Paenibacillus macerans]|uniref:DUF2164 domain-containing protein n=1 Tax=Paenibacillus macerans TaxID=44252 RepID=UPI0024305AE2|nr:DUF2164 domain-containing protein [Paenibacillus macerans]MBS5913229.1 DUF2164 domain-containing protein [Paenibacillus macerans]
MPLKPIHLTKEQRNLVIPQIQQFFEEERGETLGELAADGVLDFFLTRIGPYVYNQALADCRQVLNERMVTLEEDIRPGGSSAPAAVTSAARRCRSRLPKHPPGARGSFRFPDACRHYTLRHIKISSTYCPPIKNSPMSRPCSTNPQLS